MCIPSPGANIGLAAILSFSSSASWRRLALALLFWNQILTWVSVRLSEAENSARSAIERYCFWRNLRSRARSCDVVKGVLGFRFVLCFRSVHCTLGPANGGRISDEPAGWEERKIQKEWLIVLLKENINLIISNRLGVMLELLVNPTWTITYKTENAGLVNHHTIKSGQEAHDNLLDGRVGRRSRRPSVNWVVAILTLIIGCLILLCQRTRTNISALCHRLQWTFYGDLSCAGQYFFLIFGYNCVWLWQNWHDWGHLRHESIPLHK